MKTNEELRAVVHRLHGYDRHGSVLLDIIARLPPPPEPSAEVKPALYPGDPDFDLLASFITDGIQPVSRELRRIYEMGIAAGRAGR